MGMKKQGGREKAGLGQHHQGVNTSAKGASHVIRFRFLQQQGALGFSMPIMNQKDGNANVELLTLTHEIEFRILYYIRLDFMNE